MEGEPTPRETRLLFGKVGKGAGLLPVEPVPGDRDRDKDGAGQDTGCGQGEGGESGWQGLGGNKEQVWGSACCAAHAWELG